MGALVDFGNSIENFSYTEYCATGAHEYAVVMILHFGTFIYILNKVTNEYSWVDRVWSLLPIIFAGHLLYYQDHCQMQTITLRQKIAFVLITLWGMRLTYNYWRKGGYKPGEGEDYRWAYIRKNYPKFLVELLTFFFTSYYQIILIYWFTAPIKHAAQPHDLTLIDVFLFGLWILLFAGEIIADQQMWDFQTTKYQMLAKNGNDINALPEPYKKGFITDGLFKYSRHPNFFCEISIWWVLFAISVASEGLNWSGMGAFLLTTLFQGSTALTEKITSEKYPRYKSYQNDVSMLIPMPPKKKVKDY